MTRSLGFFKILLFLLCAHFLFVDPLYTIEDKFIQKNGPGIHHLCFRVKDISAKQAELEDKGYRFIYDKPFAGAGNCTVNFIHPKSMDGVLIEISEKSE